MPYPNFIKVSCVVPMVGFSVSGQGWTWWMSKTNVAICHEHKIDQSIYDTELNVTLEHWHHVTLVWQHVASQMVVYVYKEDGSFEYVS
jgi:hypothetical protein